VTRISTKIAERHSDRTAIPPHPIIDEHFRHYRRCRTASSDVLTHGAPLISTSTNERHAAVRLGLGRRVSRTAQRSDRVSPGNTALSHFELVAPGEPRFKQHRPNRALFFFDPDARIVHLSRDISRKTGRAGDEEKLFLILPAKFFKSLDDRLNCFRFRTISSATQEVTDNGPRKRRRLARTPCTLSSVIPPIARGDSHSFTNSAQACPGRARVTGPLWCGPTIWGQKAM